MTNYTKYEPGSFRDRESRVFYEGNAVFRGLSKQALKEWEALSSTEFFKRLTLQGKLIHTERIDSASMAKSAKDENWEAVLKHQPIPFISYPYEWSFGMLKDAALLQLDLMQEALEEGMILKDASAFNFQWMGARPIFIDIPSFEKWHPGEPWAGYRQFCQMFLYPLFLQAYKDLSFQPWLRGNIEGIESEQCNNIMSMRDCIRPGVFTHVFLQSKIQAKYSQTQRDVKKDLLAVGFNKNLIMANVKRIYKMIQGLTWNRSKSAWSSYGTTHNYTDVDFEMKQAFIRQIVGQRPWHLVWDMGCNTGIFSKIASENSDYVVAMDTDQLSIEHFYQSLKTEGNTKILPLVVNLADPSPGLGWKGLERKALVDRGKPDLTLCLALIHHIVITANVPLREFIKWLAGLGTDLVIEYVTKDDPMVKGLLRNKKDNYTDYEQDYFEKCLSLSFNVDQQSQLHSGTRILYYGKSKSRTGAA